MDTLERVREIIADVTQNSVEHITERSAATNVDGWDDTAQMSIIAAIEMDFGVLFPEREATTLNSVRKIVLALRDQEELAA